MKVAICHRSIFNGDAIGHDILGMQYCLQSIGCEVDLVGEHFDQALSANSNALRLEKVKINKYDLLIYHHSIYWLRGEKELLDRFHKNILIKYHNITPPGFFLNYSEKYAEACQKGRNQTQNFVKRVGEIHWLADSQFNAEELIALGVERKKVLVAPPLHKIRPRFNARNSNSEQVIAFFIGRYAPNKGHVHLLKIAYAFRKTIPLDFQLIVVGVKDKELYNYHDELQQLAQKLDVEDQVDFCGKEPADIVDRLFDEADVLLFMSEHEGFGVPIIEAQAYGLPVIATSCSAIGETMGEGQLAISPPQSDLDYAVIARLCFAVKRNRDLRQTLIERGYQNFYSRFEREHLENVFIKQVLALTQGSLW